MEDDRVWSFEESLWIADAEHYATCVDDGVLMVLPHPPYVLEGSEAIQSVQNTPRWSKVEFSDGRISRPQEGLIVVAYHVRAEKEGETYEAHCSSTYRWLSHENWRVVQHQQTPPLAIGVEE